MPLDIKQKATLSKRGFAQILQDICKLCWKKLFFLFRLPAQCAALNSLHQKYLSLASLINNENNITALSHQWTKFQYAIELEATNRENICISLWSIQLFWAVWFLCFVVLGGLFLIGRGGWKSAWKYGINEVGMYKILVQNSPWSRPYCLGHWPVWCLLWSASPLP